MAEARRTEPTNERKRYYQSRGFSTYYFANAVFNVVRSPMAYMRGIEEILGDLGTAWFTKPFKSYTNLHEFARSVISEILFDDIYDPDGDLAFFDEFVKSYGVPIALAEYIEDRDALFDAISESEELDRSLEELTDEVFHVLFNDVGFLQKFNLLVASYIQDAGFDPDGNPDVTKKGTLRRVRIPKWARKAIYFRDRGECRACKRTLAMTVNQTEYERYDHIVPLASYGANDVTNLQLLCEECNLKKSARAEPVSELYLKTLQR